MAYVSTGYNAVRTRYEQAKAAKSRIAPYQSPSTVGPDSAPSRRFGTKGDLEEVRHASGLGDVKSTNGPAAQYRGEGRRMTFEEKKLYARAKQDKEYKEAHSGTTKEIEARKQTAKREQRHEDNLSDSEAQGRVRAAIRARRAGATTTIRKQGVGIYTSRNATAEDLDKKGNLPTNSPAKQALINKFRK